MDDYLQLLQSPYSFLAERDIVKRQQKQKKTAAVAQRHEPFDIYPKAKEPIEKEHN